MKTTVEMARKANLLFPGTDHVDGSIEQLEHFAELVRADEREACAQLCEDIWQTAHDIQDAIRARGETK